eukprot:TRINITY_DN10280_c0_g4_i2.p1 TRINITY_DN10280_c0_g4~~TRINITY_DN10280_c0_g4_i2.p1  ORF type:complete len:336 (+),score=80.73 TRINITY_DN10280_c0_g4_i2:463-1470(+)
MNESYTDLRNYYEIFLDSYSDLDDAKDIEEMYDKKIMLLLKTEERYWATKFTIIQAEYQILATIYKILKLELEDFVLKNDMIANYMANTEIDSAEYIDTVLHINKMYQEKAAKITKNYRRFNLIYFLVTLLCSYMAIFGIFGVFMWIRRKKLLAMSFFTHVPARSLEELIQSCEEFISLLTLSEDKKKSLEESIGNSLRYSTDGDTESLLNANRGQYENKYKKTPVKSTKVFKDDCYSFMLTVFKFAVISVVVGSFNLAFFLIFKFQFEHLVDSGNLAIKTANIELSSITLLVLLRESASKDIGVFTLSNEYYQFRDTLNESVQILKAFEDVGCL